MARIRTPGVGGLVEDNPLAAGATTLTSAGLAALPTFGVSDFALVMFDPDGRTGEPFAKRISAHTAGATTATMDAAAITGTARSIDRDTRWAITDILDQDGNGSGLIGLTQHNPGTTSTYSTTSTTFTDMDATNLAVTFTVPPSGKVLVVLNALASVGDTSTSLDWNLREGGADLAGTAARVTGLVSGQQRPRLANLITGLTPGSAKTYKWGFARASGGGGAWSYAGGNTGPAVMEVWAVNV